MLLRKKPPVPIAAGVAPHRPPDTEALRLRALAVSWQRDRQVGRKRLGLRWAMWCALRFGLPASIGVALVWLASPLQQREQQRQETQAQPIQLKSTPQLNAKEPR